MTAPLAPTDVAELIDATKIEALKVSCRTTAAQALAVVRDGVITGEGPTTKGRVHFSRALDADDDVVITATPAESYPRYSRRLRPSMSRGWATFRPT